VEEKHPKTKRRLRPSATIREVSQQAKIEKPKKVSLVRRLFRFIGRRLSFLRFIFRPIKWIGRHFIPRYIRNSFQELRQVTWPDRKQSRQLTTAVVMFATVFGIVVALLDYGLDKLFKKVFLHE
jgi:preprotein translocase subunit SecE